MIYKYNNCIEYNNFILYACLWVWPSCPEVQQERQSEEDPLTSLEIEPHAAT